MFAYPYLIRLSVAHQYLVQATTYHPWSTNPLLHTMSRFYPGSSGSPVFKIEKQRGVLVAWKGEQDGSLLYSPISGVVKLAPCKFRTTTDNHSECHLVYGGLLTGDVVEAYPYAIQNLEHTEMCIGAFLSYDAVLNSQGHWVAVNLAFIGYPLERVPSAMDPNKLQLSVKAVITRVDSRPVAENTSRMWMWNDLIGRVFCDVFCRDHACFVGDDFDGVVEYTGGDGGPGAEITGGEDVPWSVVCGGACRPPLTASVFSTSLVLKTSDEWRVVKEDSPLHNCMLAGREGKSVYASWNDVNERIDGLRHGARCRVTWIPQIGNGHRFLRALIVTPLGIYGHPLFIHPKEEEATPAHPKNDVINAEIPSK